MSIAMEYISSAPETRRDQRSPLRHDPLLGWLDSLEEWAIAEDWDLVEAVFRRNGQWLLKKAVIRSDTTSIRRLRSLRDRLATVVLLGSDPAPRTILSSSRDGGGMVDWATFDFDGLLNDVEK